MNWLEKLEKLRKLRKNDIFVDARFRENLWEPNEIRKIHQQFPLLSNSYLKFIEKYDSIGIAFVIFYGSKKANIIPIENELQQYENVLKGEYFPFADYPDGSRFILNTKEQVLWWDKYDDDLEKPKLLADSFDEFMDECLLGKRFGEFSYTEDNTFYDLLQSQGWV